MIPGCNHEEAMVNCTPCAAWLAEQPAECEGRAYCNKDNQWLRRELTPVNDEERVRSLCPECLKANRRAVAWESRGDDLRDERKMEFDR